MFELLTRDKNILSMLAKYGVLSTERIAATFFEGVAHTTVMRRLRKLEKLGFILRLPGLPNAMNGWCLSKHGANAISVGDPFRYSNKNVLFHEVTLTDVRLTLDRVGIGENWTSEMEMRRARQWVPNGWGEDVVIPDGVFVTDKNGKPAVVAVELELTPKNHARYDRLLRHYRQKDTLNHIWYIVATAGIGDLVRRKWSQLQRWDYSPTLIVSLLDEVLKDTRTARVWSPPTGAPDELQKYFDLKPLLSEAVKGGRLSAQRVSSFGGREVSNPKVSESNSNQRDRSAPDFERGVPSALDPSPPTNVEREGSRPTGTVKKSGADGKGVEGDYEIKLGVG